MSAAEKINKKKRSPDKKHKSTSKNESIQPKKSIKEKFADILELPKEIMLNVPKFTLVGTSDIMIENYKGVIEYSDARIRINTGTGIVKIIGAKLLIKEITSEDIIIGGEISGLEFQK